MYWPPVDGCTGLPVIAFGMVPGTWQQVSDTTKEESLRDGNKPIHEHKHKHKHTHKQNLKFKNRKIEKLSTF